MQKMFSKICDAHVHLTHCAELHSVLGRQDYRACCSLHTEAEVRMFEQDIAPRAPGRIAASFGVHPQNPVADLLPLLERLARCKRIAAAGECGFDYFTPEYAARKAEQESVWRAQLELALSFRLPLVVHARKAMPRVFEYAVQLKALPAVVFHSFAGSPTEAQSLLKRGVNAYFSFGKPILNGNKRAIACVSQLPAARLLLETDAPYQTLRGEEQTFPAEIARVYAQAFALRALDSAAAQEEFCAALAGNFRAVYGI